MMKRLLSLVLMMTMVAGLMSGCAVGSQEESENAMSVYYLDVWGSGLLAESHELSSTDATDQIRELLTLLADTPETVGYRRTIPEGVEATWISVDEGILTVNFNQEYKDLSGYNEVLIRAAVVKTLLQVEGISGVAFYVADSPLTSSSGALVGTMTADMFIDDYGEETESLSEATLTLYFATVDGKSLIKKDVDIYYNSNVSMERLVVENLISGCDDEDALSPIPSGTKLVSITVTDGICYVNFDSTFVNSDSGISSAVVLYSIVNSLTELSTITKVQILVDGSATMPTGGFDFSLGTSYIRDLSLVVESSDTE